MEFSVPSTDEVEIVTERGVRSRFDTPLGSLGGKKLETKDSRSEKIAIVGRQILKSAQTYVRTNFEEAIEKAKEDILKDDVDMEERELSRRLNEDPEVQFWVAALENVEGASLDGIQNWSYVLISSPIVSLQPVHSIRAESLSFLIRTHMWLKLERSRTRSCQQCSLTRSSLRQDCLRNLFTMTTNLQ